MSQSFQDISLADAADLPQIFTVWESAVRATHAFLAEADIQLLIPLVKEGLAHFGPIHYLRDADGLVVAFMGVEKAKIEMLFVHAAQRGRGAGRILTEYAIGELGARLVDVNEQNGQAIGFYAHLGFRPCGRSPLDSSGNPFPIIHMELGPDASCRPDPDGGGGSG